MQHTTSLEVSKNLKEAGLEGKAEYYWIPTGTVENWKSQYEAKHKSQIKFFKHAIPAYTLSELIRELPDDVYLYHRSDLNQWYVRIKPLNEAFADTPEDAAAEAWIELNKKEK
jgi:hypothetical protein